MEVKYCHLSPPKHSQWLLSANHCVSVIWWQLCFQLMFGLITLFSAPAFVLTLFLIYCPIFSTSAFFVVLFPSTVPQHQNVHARVQSCVLIYTNLSTAAGHTCFSFWQDCFFYCCSQQLRLIDLRWVCLQIHIFKFSLPNIYRLMLLFFVCLTLLSNKLSYTHFKKYS